MQRSFELVGTAEFPKGVRVSKEDGFKFPKGKGNWTPVLALYNRETNETLTGEDVLQERLGITLVEYDKVIP